MKVQLLEYLDQLEATAKSAPRGNWSIDRRVPLGCVRTDKFIPLLGYQGHVVVRDIPPGAEEHIVATQPQATLALIAKLRDAVELIRIASIADNHLERELAKLLELEVTE